MPKFKRVKVKHKKGKMVCPVCDQIIRGKVGKVGKEYVYRKYECQTPRCGYAFYSEAAQSMEVFAGLVNLHANIDYFCLKPGMEDLHKQVKKHIKTRNKVLREMREVMHNPECKMIFECFQSPNANKLGLSKAFLKWLRNQKRKFPFTIRSVNNKVAYYEDLEERRKADEKDNHGNGGFNPGTGGNSGPLD